MKKRFTFFAFLMTLSIAMFAQNDINFRYYPSMKYTRIDVKKQTDSVTNVVTWKSDTVRLEVRAIIEKNDGKLTIFNTTDLTSTHYESKVKFVGVSQDALQALVYQAEKGETIVTNPIAGFTMIIFFSNCEDASTIPPGQQPRCETSTHYFGNFPGL